MSGDLRRFLFGGWLNVALGLADGGANWFEGLQLIAVYLILAFAFYLVPG